MKNSVGNPQKFIRKLNKHQTEQCRYLANLSDLFLAKCFYGDSAEEGQIFQGKCTEIVHKLNKQQIE